MRIAAMKSIITTLRSQMQLSIDRNGGKEQEISAAKRMRGKWKEAPKETIPSTTFIYTLLYPPPLLFLLHRFCLRNFFWSSDATQPFKLAALISAATVLLCKRVVLLLFVFLISCKQQLFPLHYLRRANEACEAHLKAGILTYTRSQWGHFFACGLSSGLCVCLCRDKFELVA